MKHKVGDTVTIRKDLIAGKRYGGKNINNTGRMNKYFGKQATITKVYVDFYDLDIDNGWWSWTDKMFEEKPKTYKGWEILKMIDEGNLKEGDKIISDADIVYIVDHFTNQRYLNSTNSNRILTPLALQLRTFTIKEKEYMTFDEARKLGIPKHKNLGFTLSGTNYGMQQFIRDMDMKLWEVE